MQSPSYYKNLALESLKSKWTEPVLCTLLYLIIAIGVSLTTDDKNSTLLIIIGLVLSFVIIPLGWSYEVLFLDFKREGRTSIGALFHGYQKPWLPKSFLLPLLVAIFTFLWALLLIIPGIIKSYAYAMAPYILKDNSEIGCNEAIDESMRLMEDHKWDLFLIDLSFLGWLLLSILTLGIGLLWLYPYWLTARVHFYEDLKREKGMATDIV